MDISYYCIILRKRNRGLIFFEFNLHHDFLNRLRELVK